MFSFGFGWRGKESNEWAIGLIIGCLIVEFYWPKNILKQ